MITMRQRAGNVALLVLGGAVGAIAAFGLARVLEIRLAEEALLRYAQDTLHVVDSSAAELDAGLNKVAQDGLPFCSDDEIALMRRIVYEAAFVKDLGRTQDGRLYCTSGLGRISKPPPMPAPVLSFYSANQGAQVEIMPDNALALAPSARGFIAELRGVTAVLNPALYASLNDPPMYVSGMVRDTQHQVVAPAFGRPTPLSTGEVLAGKLLERGGTMYQPLCDNVRAICVIATETRADMLARRRGVFISFPATTVIFSVAGGVLGLSIASSIVLFYHRQRSLERRLRRAIRNRQIVCAYQPVVDLATNAVVGAEALARWTDDSGESIPPDVFIPVAEDKGFIGAVTRLVLDRVLEDMRSLLIDGSFQVTLNLSSSDLGDPRFFAHLEAGLWRTSIPARSIGFEITERATALHTEGQAGIAKLRAAGHMVYLDDFGTGYSSLSYLHDLHADAIKVDRAFTRTVGTEAVTASVVPNILEMACRLGLGIVVEGIETVEQAEYFRRACPAARGQGWLFGRPVPALEFKFQQRMRSPSAPQSAASAETPPLDSGSER
jgi:sensor c-di-GMP phosphodiesterase-like protein